MSTKKNIDRLFQEKFKEFDVKPDPKIWKNIQSEIQEDNEKTVAVIPLWLKLTGIAASLALLLFLGKSVINSPENLALPSTVDTKETIKNSPKEIFNNESKDNTSNNQEETTVDNNKTNTPQVVNTDASSSSNVNSNTKNKNTNHNKTNKLTISVTNSSNDNNKSNIRGNKFINQNNNNSNALAQNTNPLVKDQLNTNNVTVTKKSYVTGNNSPTEKNTLNTNNNDLSVNKAVTEKNQEEKNKNPQDPSIEDAIAENKNTEDLIEKEEVNNRWSVNASIAPVYYNTFGEGSHLHEQFNENNKSGEINTSYGIKVGYAFNDKLTVRSGINRLNLSYDTDDVVVYEKIMSGSNNTSSFRNIDFTSTSNGHELSMISAKNVNKMEVSKSFNAAISQRMNYFEIPLEIEYKLLDKRFGINLIGGVSSFILNDNEVVSELNGTDSKIGEANNVNSFSFSTNFGIGLNYKFSNTVIFNLEPTFKYQLNAFSDTSGSFNPYILGLYTGFSYRF